MRLIICFLLQVAVQSMLKPMKILVLGGTGFLGHSVINEMCEKYPDTYSITSISRRGILPDEKNLGVNWLAGDANEIVKDVIQKEGPFDICFHCIGLLLDNDSGLSILNKFASGSGSVPDEKSTYDYVTRQTAMNAISSIKAQQTNRNARLPTFIFVSAAEAGWTVRPPISWLSRYLDAKQAVERELKQSRDKLRPVIFRPSLIWSMSRPQALLSVAPFYVGSLVGLPGVDRPVLVESLVSAILEACTNQDVSGIQRYKDIDILSAKQASRNIANKKSNM